MTNLVLCGGSGTRLWPLSRKRLPKQFLHLFEHYSLFEKTLIRNLGLAQQFWIVSGTELVEHVQDGLTRIGVRAKILVEPIGRNTAPAIALACLSLPDDELVLVSPSDHMIAHLGEYRAAVENACALAEEGALVTFGVHPSYPETGYGYIEYDGNKVVSFREKPDADTAKDYCHSGRHLWNSGMLMFRVSVFWKELERWAPEVAEACRLAGPEPTKEAMEAIPSISIDYALLEKSNNVRVVPCDPGWSDVGSFEALCEQLPRSADGNAFLNSVADGTTPIYVDAKNNHVLGGPRKVVLVGVDDLVVVDTDDALLVMKKGYGQKVKAVMEMVNDSDQGLM
jgi:mannose-1-phosphate guanylyltransferase